MDIAALDRSVEQRVLQVFAVLWRYKLLFALTAATAFSALSLMVLALQPSFEATAVLVSGQGSLETTSGNARQVNEAPQTLMRIAESEEVVRRAIETVGPADLAPETNLNQQSGIDRLRAMIFGVEMVRRTAADPVTALLPSVMARFSVRAEPTSGVIRISFRHGDPETATQFANAAAQAFVDRYIALYSRPGAVQFFMNQQGRLDQDFAEASQRFEQFSKQTGVFAVEQQRELLLRRLSELDAALAQTRNTVAEKQGQRQALGEQLRRLAPVARSNYVSSLVDSLAGERPQATTRTPDSRALDERASDPPLLLVRVYQDSMVTLFKINGELAGAQNAQAQLAEEQTRLTMQLNKLAEVTEEYARLRRAVDQAATSSDLNSRRMVEEQINAELSAARFSSVRMLQRATVPLRPAFPNYQLGLLVAAIASCLIASGVVLVVNLIRRNWFRKRVGPAHAGAGVEKR